MELLERERFLQALSAALSHVVAVTGHTAVISGEAGIGKTTPRSNEDDSHRAGSSM